MDNWQREVISQKSQEIRAKMIGGSVYGVPITDVGDIDLVIVATYHMGRSEETAFYSKEMSEFKHIY